MSVEFRLENTILIMEVRGTLSIHDMRGVRAESADLTAEHGLSKLLVDIREAGLAITATEIFEFMASFGDLFPASTKHAVVYSPEAFDPENAAFGEMVAANRGIPIRMFTDMDEARRWLLSDERAS